MLWIPFNYFVDQLFMEIFILQTSILFSLIYLLIDSIKSIRNIPNLSHLSNLSKISFPMVSIILPARNEEKYIARCLDSLLTQDYPNYEIISIDDSSSDNTAKIIKQYGIKYNKVIYANTEPVPPGWSGKNWACYQGYIKSKGSLLLFTDADSIHSSSTVALAVKHLVSEKLDAITIIPKTLANDFWTKTTLPVLWTFSVVRFSPLKANNPKSDVGFFYGSFFLITRQTYESVGTHKSVSQEIAEDAELGRKVKEKGFKIKVIHGEKYVQALWSRNSLDLWHGLHRIMVPLYSRQKAKGLLMVITIFVILLLPLILQPLIFIIALYEKDTLKDLILLFLAGISILLIIINNVLQIRTNLCQSFVYSLLFPLSGLVILFAFLSSIIKWKQKDIINWRDRKYSIKSE